MTTHVEYDDFGEYIEMLEDLDETTPDRPDRYSRFRERFVQRIISLNLVIKYVV